MSARHDLATTRAWAVDGTRLVVGALASLPDDAFTGPSLLPGWTRAHVGAHLARNAEALTRLASWARTGEESPMYAGPEQRDADIESSARQSPAALRHDVTATAAVLDQALDALTGPAWDAPVGVRQGQQVAARLLPWLRVREVWLHAVDLDAAVDLSAAPPPLLDELVADITARLSTEPSCPRVGLRLVDRDVTWPLGSPAGPGGQQAATTVEGSAADVVLWLAGRSDGARLRTPGPLPALPRWL